MAIRNGYCTRQDLQQWLTHGTPSTNATDDVVIDWIIEGVSRAMDNFCGRSFYPRIATRNYDVPDSDTVYLDDDLLSLTTFTNGDDTVIAAAEYVLKSVGETPYWAVKLRDSSSISWEVDANDSAEQVIDVTGVWGYHREYTQAWYTATTLAAAIVDTTSTTFTVTSVANFGIGAIVKIDSEYFTITSYTSTPTVTITVTQRGDNGSTAATHLNGATIYLWRPEPTIKMLALQIALSIYKRRFGENVTNTTMITGAGVIITPDDIPSSAQKMLQNFLRLE